MMNQETNAGHPPGCRTWAVARKTATSLPGVAAMVLLASVQPPARAQTFTNLWAFGDSFADQGNAENLLTNEGLPYPSHVPGPILYHTYPYYLQSLYSVPSAEYYNYAIDGATSTTLHIAYPTLFGMTTEVAIFSASQQRIPPNNLVTISIGLNDPGLYGPYLTPPQVAAQTTYDVSRAAQTLIAAGARTFAIAGFSDDAVFPEFHTATADPTYLTQYSAEYYQSLQTALASLSRPGVRFFLFDESRLFQQVSADPAAYGFSSATIFCDQVPGCKRQPDSPLQFQYLSYDGLHFTSGGFALEARYMANQLMAPNSIPAETSLAQIGASSFVNAIFDRLNANRGQGAVPGSPVAAAATTTPGSPWSIYLQGLGTFGHRDSRFGATGFDYSDGGVIFGGEYNVNPYLLVGLGFNYSSPSAGLQGGAGNIGLNQYQFAGYASYTAPHLFTDAIVSGGHNSFSVTRPGIISTITASPNGQSYVAGFDSGYLFDMPGFRIGPIVGLTYADSHVNSYTESGDPLITQSVGGQHENSLSGSAGLQARLPVALATGLVINPYVDLTAERDFLGNSRVLTTTFTAAPALPIYSIVGGSGNGTYGRVSGGLSGKITPNVSAGIQGEVTFARPGGNDYGVTANVAYRF